jgi:hypothetical protein
MLTGKESRKLERRPQKRIIPLKPQTASPSMGRPKTAKETTPGSSRPVCHDSQSAAYGGNFLIEAEETGAARASDCSRPGIPNRLTRPDSVVSLGPNAVIIIGQQSTHSAIGGHSLTRGDVIH